VNLWLFVALQVALGQYCFENVGPTTTLDANLGAVALAGKTKTIFETSECPGQVGPIDATFLVADLVPGFNYSLSYYVVTCGNQYPVLSGAWIDYNGNAQFDSNELLGGAFSDQRGLIVLNFTAMNNSNIVYGPTRLRVQVQETSATSIDPCFAFPYGATKDFTVEMIPQFPGYCNSGPTSDLDTQMGAVYVFGEVRNIVELTGCPGHLGPVNYTNLTADLITGNTYHINFTVITCSSIFSVTSAAWIDYNGNSVFDHWEQIFPFSKRFGSQMFAFKVPKSTPTEVVKPGITRMRVQVQETSQSDIDPCTIFNYGGTKDFAIEIKMSIDGGWGPWGACNATCGSGWQTRKCDNPTPSAEGAPCVGEPFTACNTQCASGNGGKIAAGILVPLIIIGGVAAFYFYQKRKKSGELSDDFVSNEAPAGQTSSYQTAA